MSLFLFPQSFFVFKRFMERFNKELSSLNCCFFSEINENHLFIWKIWSTFDQWCIKCVQFFDIILIFAKLSCSHHFLDWLEIFEGITFEDSKWLFFIFLFKIFNWGFDFLFKLLEKLFSFFFHAFNVFKILLKNLLFYFITKLIDFLRFKRNWFLKLLKLSFKIITTTIIGQITFLLTHITPGIFHIRDCTLVNSGDVWSENVQVHFSIQKLIFKLFRIKSL